jgi:hypothetical protein
VVRIIIQNKVVKTILQQPEKITTLHVALPVQLFAEPATL